MKYVNLGRTGLRVSRLCLGCMTYGDKSWRDWILTEAESRPFFKKAGRGPTGLPVGSFIEQFPLSRAAPPSGSPPPPHLRWRG